MSQLAAASPEYCHLIPENLLRIQNQDRLTSSAGALVLNVSGLRYQGRLTSSAGALVLNVPGLRYQGRLTSISGAWC